MKVFCTQDNFKRAISVTEKITGKQITLPVLENILLETEKGMLKISATNLEIGVTLKVGAKIEREGKITIPGKLIGSYVSNLPASDVVILESKDLTLRVKSGNYEAHIKGIGAHEYPIIPESKSNFLFSLKTSDLKNIASKILNCVAIENVRPELSGINIMFFDKHINLAATDSFRLAEGKIVIKTSEDYSRFTDKTKSVIVPTQIFSEIIRANEEDEEEIKIIAEENQIFMQVGIVKFVSRLINGKYPEYKHIIPKKFLTSVLTNREDLLRAIKIASAFTSRKAGEVSIIIKENTIVVESGSTETGENRTELPAVVSGPEQKIIFNPRYIIDGIISAVTEKIVLLINSESSPAAIKMIDGKTKKEIEDFIYIVMPIKN